MRAVFDLASKGEIVAAVLVGGIIVIWLALSGGRALLNGAGIQLHQPALLAAPILLALLETLLFLPAALTSSLLDDSQRGLAGGLLVALVWGINGAVSVRRWLLARNPRPTKP